MATEALVQVVDVDRYLAMVGEFGKMQILLQMMYCLMIFPTTYQDLLLVFVANNPPWKCTGMNTECNTTNEIFDVTHVGYEKRCQLENRSSWEFTKPKKFSIVTEWDLVCEREELAHFANSAIFIGWIISALAIGFLSDRFGRKKILFPSLFLTVLCGFVSAFTQDFWQFLLLRFFVGIFQQGSVIVICTSVNEMVGPRYRALSGTLVWFAYTLVLCLIDLQAWLVSDWRLLEIMVTAPYVVFVLFWKFIPESIRWLRINDRLEEAEKILEKISRVNGKPTPNVKLSKEEKVINHSTIVHLFRPWPTCRSSLVQCFTWFANGLMYFGVSIASGDLGGNLYRDFFFISLVEIPANAAAIVLPNKFGRKPTAMLSMFVAGVACIVIAVVPSGTSYAGYIWLRVALGIIGKFCITLSYDTVIIWSGEIHPTVVRSQGIGLMMIASATGAATSPWVAKWLNNFHTSVPFAVMGGCAVIAAFLCKMLKETKDKPTAEIFGHEQQIKEHGQNNTEQNEDVALL